MVQGDGDAHLGSFLQVGGVELPGQCQLGAEVNVLLVQHRGEAAIIDLHLHQGAGLQQRGVADGEGGGVAAQLVQHLQAGFRGGSHVVHIVGLHVFALVQDDASRVALQRENTRHHCVA